MAIHLARPGESIRRRWTSAAIAVVAMLVLGLELRHRVEVNAARATDAILVRGRMLAERAATIPRVAEGELGRIFPGLSPSVRPGWPRIPSFGFTGRAFIRRRWKSPPLRQHPAVLDAPARSQAGRVLGHAVRMVGLMGLGLGFSLRPGPGRRKPAAASFAKRSTACGGSSVRRWYTWPFFLLRRSSSPGICRCIAGGSVEPVRPFVGLAISGRSFGDGRFWHSLGLRDRAVYHLCAGHDGTLTRGRAGARPEWSPRSAGPERVLSSLSSPRSSPSPWSGSGCFRPISA